MKLLKYSSPSFKTYNSAGALGVFINAHPYGEEYIINNLIQLECREEFLMDDIVLDLNFSISHPQKIGFLEVRHINHFFIKDCVSEVIKNLLDNNYYIMFQGIDDYYISNKSSYHTRHYSHDGLIYGYNQKSYYLSAYDINWQYSTWLINKKEFIQGFNSRFCAFSGYFWAVKIVDNSEIKIDINNIYNNLLEYLRLKKNKRENEDDELKKVYGLDVVKSLLKYIEYVKFSSRELDFRPFSLLYEHKGFMLERIKIIESLTTIHGLSLRYQIVYNTSKSLKNLCIKYNLTKNHKILDSIIEYIKLMSKTEYEILLDLVCDEAILSNNY